MITCGCGYEWRYRGSSWRTHCQECKKGYYIPVSVRPDVEVQQAHSERHRPTTIARSITIAPPPEPLIAPPVRPIEERVPKSLERIMGDARPRPSRSRDSGPIVPMWQLLEKGFGSMAKAMTSSSGQPAAPNRRISAPAPPKPVSAAPAALPVPRRAHVEPHFAVHQVRRAQSAVLAPHSARSVTAPCHLHPPHRGRLPLPRGNRHLPLGRWSRCLSQATATPRRSPSRWDSAGPWSTTVRDRSTTAPPLVVLLEPQCSQLRIERDPNPDRQLAVPIKAGRQSPPALWAIDHPGAVVPLDRGVMGITHSDRPPPRNCRFTRGAQ